MKMQKMMWIEMTVKLMNAFEKANLTFFVFVVYYSLVVLKQLFANGSNVRLSSDLTQAFQLHIARVDCNAGIYWLDLIGMLNESLKMESFVVVVVVVAVD